MCETKSEAPVHRALSILLLWPKLDSPPWLSNSSSLLSSHSFPDSSSFKDQNKHKWYFIFQYSQIRRIQELFFQMQWKNNHLLSANKTSSSGVHCHIIIHLCYVPGRHNSWCLASAGSRILAPVTFIPCHYSCEYVTLCDKGDFAHSVKITSELTENREIILD